MSPVTHDFSGALDSVLADLKAGRPFALGRFNDGEYKICRGQRYTAVDGWRVGRNAWFKDALLDALTYSAAGYVVGVTAPCCGVRASQWYDKQRQGRQTFGTVFSHANYPRAHDELAQVDAFRVSSAEGADLQLPANCITSAWDYTWVVDALTEVTKPVFLSVGPLANILIHETWKRRQDVALVDVGAVFDDREYQRPKQGGPNHSCAWVLGDAVSETPSARPTTVVVSETPSSRPTSPIVVSETPSSRPPSPIVVATSPVAVAPTAVPAEEIPRRELPRDRVLRSRRQRKP